jgi:hypothetical protein
MVALFARLFTRGPLAHINCLDAVNKISTRLARFRHLLANFGGEILKQG